jgi:hypothetical protein
MKESNIEDGFWVFVSHSTKDFDRVRLVRNALEESGFRPILFYLKCLEDEDEINDLLKREIDARKRFILCDSPNAQASKFVQSEVSYIKERHRMYEIVDLSSLDLDSESIQDDVIQLIKPFRIRTNVYLSYNHYDRGLAQLICKNLKLQGFNSTDTTFLETQEWYRYFEGREGLIQVKRDAIESILSNGYLLYLIGESVSYFGQEELEHAYEIAPQMILLVIISKESIKYIPSFYQNGNFLDLSEITSDEEKAKAVVEKLISLDLENQYNHTRVE